MTRPTQDTAAVPFNLWWQIGILGDRIEPLRVIRETSAMVEYLDRHGKPRRCRKESAHPTYDDARRALIVRQEARVEHARQYLAREEDRLRQVHLTPRQPGEGGAA